MTLVHCSYINFQHGGRQGADYSGNGGPYDFTGLVKIMSAGVWPALLGIGEAERWEFNGGEGANEAAIALRKAGGPPYVAHVGSLPRDGGPFGPAILYDPTKIQARRWYDHRLPDFGSRNRNLFEFSLLDDPDEYFRCIIWHGDIHNGDMRLADATTFDRFADPKIGCLILADWNSTLSGPWEARDFDNHSAHPPHRVAHKIEFQHGPKQAGPHVEDTRALDFLCGWWQPDDGAQQGHRVGGIGFYDIAELAGDFTPTQLPTPWRRKPRAIDRALVNERLRKAYVDRSYQVHQPDDPQHPRSDHLRISFALDI